MDTAVVLAVAELATGAVVAVWATDKLLQGLVGIARYLPVSIFAVGALLSGLEAENVAVGLAAGVEDAPEIALGTVFGGAIFLVCVALGLGAVVAPLELRLPRSFLILLAVTPVIAGVGILGPVTTPAAGILLLAAFAAAMAFVVLRSHDERFGLDEELEEAIERPRSRPAVAAITLIGLAGLTIGGKLVAGGATGLVTSLGLAPLLVGMVVAPAAIELEEVARQAVPARRGRPEVSAANLVGTLLYFCLFNLGLIALLSPVAVDPGVRALDWPFLVGATWLATAFLWNGRVGRFEGAVLLTAYALYVALRVTS